MSGLNTQAADQKNHLSLSTARIGIESGKSTHAGSIATTRAWFAIRYTLFLFGKAIKISRFAGQAGPCSVKARHNASLTETGKCPGSRLLTG
jgi:hypothetical protein